RQAFVISDLCPGEVTVELVQLTIRMRSSALPAVSPAAVQFYGPQPVTPAILARCREILQARLSQSIISVMLLDTRRVREACAPFSGLKRMECRTSGCFPVEM